MIASAMAEGIDRAGDSVHIFPSHCYRKPDAEIAVFYGFDANLRKVFSDYRSAGLDVVYVDLGYWGRREGGSLHGYHKVVVNGRHPTSYAQASVHGPERAAALHLDIEPWKAGGDHIILAGMSEKSAHVEGFQANEWERVAIAEIRRYSSRPIIYRPKPSWLFATPLPGTRYEPGENDLPRLFGNCHAVVTHHSNVAIDALLAGIPAFTVEGAALPLCLSDLSMIEQPWRPEGRERFVADLAHTQFRPDEMRSGAVWRHLKDEGLIS